MQLPFHINNHTTHTSNIPLLFVNLTTFLGNTFFLFRETISSPWQLSTNTKQMTSYYE